MAKPFQRVAIFARERHDGSHVRETINALLSQLKKSQVSLVCEQETAALLPDAAEGMHTCSVDALEQHCDLVIVVGGDGSLLNAARAVVDLEIPVLGINRGRLGFLTDILPSELEHKVSEVLSGKYFEEQRFLLETTLPVADNEKQQQISLNDVVLSPGKTVHMIEFAIYINDKLMCSQRADGLIVASPTGSTAYALSAGGPILHPSLDAIVMVPMFAHTLSSRPIVISADSNITLVVNDANKSIPQISCDGQEGISIIPGESITIRKKKRLLRLIHPHDYNYYTTLRSKLGWQRARYRD